MKTLKIGKHETIKISSRFFEVRDIQKLLRYDYTRLTISEALKASAKLELMKPSKVLGIPVAQDDGPVDVFSKVVDLFEDDGELGSTVRSTRADEEDRHRKMLLDGIASEIKPEIAKNNEQALHVEKRTDGELVSYYFNGSVAVRFDGRQISALNATKVETIVAWVKLVWDAVSFLGTVIGIAVPRPAGGATKQLTGLLRTAQQVWQKFIDALKRIKNAVDSNETIQVFVGAWQHINLAKQGKEVLKAIFSGLSLYQKAWIVIKFAATVALFFVSAGASLILKMIQAVAQLINVVADVSEIVALEEQPT